ncbi:MAG: hypothetical protein GXY87_04565 [Tissierellia bacterium]|nr:hypothetical protein [Tissierellia bacterium]
MFTNLAAVAETRVGDPLSIGLQLVSTVLLIAIVVLLYRLLKYFKNKN